MRLWENAAIRSDSNSGKKKCNRCDATYMYEGNLKRHTYVANIITERAKNTTTLE